MSPFSRRLVGLCLAPILVWSVDCTLSLCGQSEAYWAGIGTRHTNGITSLHSYGSSVNEISPTSTYLLTNQRRRTPVCGGHCSLRPVSPPPRPPGSVN